jgi:glycosyltransferase involved in cell wall biosynthesis
MSILTQDDVSLRVLVIDDASTDDTPAVCAELAARDPRVEIRRHERNIGHIATYNEGLSWADGDYIALISADDMLTSGALARAVALLDRHPEVGLVYGGAVCFSTGTSRPAPRITNRPRPEVRSGKDWIEARCRTAQSCIFSPEVVVRGPLQRRLGGYREDLPHSGDLEMWLRFAAESDVARLPDVDQAYFRFHPASMQRMQFGDRLRELEQRSAAFGVFFAGRGCHLENAASLHRQARRQLAAEAVRATVVPFSLKRLRSPEAARLRRFAAACLNADREVRRSSRLENVRTAATLALVGAEAWPRTRIRSWYSRSAVVRTMMAPALRALGLQPTWRRISH